MRYLNMPLLLGLIPIRLGQFESFLFFRVLQTGFLYLIKKLAYPPPSLEAGQVRNIKV